MDLSGRPTFRVEKPVGTSLGDFFGDLRIWLDQRQITLTDFRPSADKSAGFDLFFRSQEAALLFEREFCRT